MALNSITVPAPTRGWNANTRIDAMDPADAIRMVNVFPSTDSAALRNGFSSFVTGLGGSIQTLAEWVGNDGTRRLIAGANNKLWQVAGASLSSTTASSITSDKWQFVNFMDKLVLVNGVDTPLQYDDGGGAAPLTITGSGLTSTDLINVSIYKQRLYYVENQTASMWYGATSTVGGAVTEFDVSDVLQLGGQIMFAGSLSRDTGTGLIDALIIVSDQGEVLVYEGDDPGAANWGLTGRFLLPPPLGRRSFIGIENELYILTEGGVTPVSKLLGFSDVSGAATFVTERIREAFISAAKSYNSNFGWSAISYPRGRYALVNIPIASDTNYEQYVMNVQTGAWCKFTGMNASTWSLFNNSLYFGGIDGTIYKADDGTDDNGNSIEVDLKWAFNYASDRAQIKRFTMAKPIFTGESSIVFGFSIDTDFRDVSSTATASIIGNPGSAWDTSAWDTATWENSGTYKADWRSIEGIGRAFALKVKGSFKNAPFTISAAPVIYETGGVL